MDDLFNSAQFHKTHRLTLHRQLNTVQLRNKRKKYITIERVKHRHVKIKNIPSPLARKFQKMPITNRKILFSGIH